MDLKELSRLLDLSATTVSRALNGYPEVNAATRARVVAAARRHGYAPNQMAKRLATGRAFAIGHVIPLSAQHVINPLFADFIAGAGETYSTAGYDMVLSVVDEDDEEGVYREMMRQRRVDGVIVHGPRLRDARIDLLREIDLPFVVHGRDLREAADVFWLDIDNRQAFSEATEMLLALGHWRIALLNGIESLHFAHDRRCGYVAALRARGIAPDPSLMRSNEMDEPYGHASVHEMMTLADPPTAFLASSILTAYGVLRAIRELGLEPGRDVSIITHDDDLSFLKNEGAPPLLTATRSSIRAAGRRTAELLIGRIDDPARAPEHELWPVEIVPGRSTGPNPHAYGPRWRRRRPR